MRISDWSSDVCSSDLVHRRPAWLAVADLLPANRLEHLSDIGLQSATPEASARALRLSAISLNCDGLRPVVDRESCWRFELELQVRMAEDAPIDHALLGVIVIEGSIERIQANRKSGVEGK